MYRTYLKPQAVFPYSFGYMTVAKIIYIQAKYNVQTT